jgi:uncharacterized membrane protein YvlD (DUF360 family)
MPTQHAPTLLVHSIALATEGTAVTVSLALTSMNAQMKPTTAMPTAPVQILTALLNATATLDTLEMALLVSTMMNAT